MTDITNEKQKAQPFDARWPVWIKYLLCYTIFLMLVGLALFILFRVRSDIIVVAFWMGYNQVIVKGISNLGVMIAGIIILGGVIFMEDHLRKGVENGLFWKRALRLVVIELGIIALSYLIYFAVVLIAG
jgi:hypothetical protein